MKVRKVTGTEYEFEDGTVLHHIPSKGWVPQEKEDRQEDKSQEYNYFIAYLCIKDGQAACGSEVYRANSSRLSAADIVTVMKDLKERYKLDSLPTITTIYKLGVY